MPSSEFCVGYDQEEFRRGAVAYSEVCPCVWQGDLQVKVRFLRVSCCPAQQTLAARFRVVNGLQTFSGLRIPSCTPLTQFSVDFGGVKAQSFLSLHECG